MSRVSIKTIALTVFGIDVLAIAIAVSRAIILDRSPMRYFGERGYMTWISTLQLVVAAVLCLQIGLIRKNSQSRYKEIKPAIFWWLASAGMFFFALDETFEIHENLDKQIRAWFGIPSNSFTGRLDDLIILIYAGVGLLLVYLSRRELLQYQKALPWFYRGLVFSGLTIALDMIGHNRETFAPFASSLEELNQIHHWVGAVEEIPKILAGGAFIVTLFACKFVAKSFRNRKAKRTASV